MSAVDLCQLPLFPLQGVVLFPGARVPLHIFEPRYRQMMRAALEGERLLGMVAVLPGQERDMGGNPPVQPIGCAGFIADHQRLADGRYDLVLRGTQRFRIHAEQPPTSTRLYRLAEVELLEEPQQPVDAARARGLRDEVLLLLEELGARSDGPPPQVPREHLADLDLQTFTSVLCTAVALEPLEKQGLLEANGVSSRLGHLAELLRFHLAALERSAQRADPSLH